MTGALHSLTPGDSLALFTVPVMMPPEMIIVPAVFAIPAIVVFARMWFRHKEKMATLGVRASDGLVNSALDARLDRIEQAVDAIAIEMERMGEGQRFVTRLLSERTGASIRGVANAPLPAPNAPGREITPN